MKSIDRAHRTETEIATSMLLRIAFEYGQTAGAPWRSRSAVCWSMPASHGHGKRGGQHEASCFISTKVDPGDDVDIVIGKAVAGIPAHMKECILKAGCIPPGEELL